MVEQKSVFVVCQTAPMLHESQETLGITQNFEDALTLLLLHWPRTGLVVEEHKLVQIEQLVKAKNKITKQNPRMIWTFENGQFYETSAKGAKGENKEEKRLVQDCPDAIKLLLTDTFIPKWRSLLITWLWSLIQHPFQLEYFSVSEPIFEPNEDVIPDTEGRKVLLDRALVALSCVPLWQERLTVTGLHAPGALEFLVHASTAEEAQKMYQ